MCGMEEIMSDDSPNTATERRSRTDRRAARAKPFSGPDRRKAPRRAEADAPPTP
jgi:hypothetical protein